MADASCRSSSSGKFSFIFFTCFSFEQDFSSFFFIKKKEKLSHFIVFHEKKKKKHGFLNDAEQILLSDDNFL